MKHAFEKGCYLSCSDPTNEDISFAADLAAFYSKARAEGKVKVIKAWVAALKKIPGAAPGKVSAESSLVMPWVPICRAYFLSDHVFHLGLIRFFVLQSWHLNLLLKSLDGSPCHTHIYICECAQRKFPTF